MKISVIIPVYNLDSYLTATLESVFAQTHAELEVIAVDDGSMDGSAVVLDAYAAREPRLTVIHQQNAGVTAARMAGIRRATGAFVGFVDGDDQIEPDMYERLLQNALTQNAEIAQCGIRFDYSDHTEYRYGTQSVRTWDRVQGLTELLQGERVEPSLCNKLFRRELLQRVFETTAADPSIRNNEDLLMNYYLFKEAKTSVYEDFCPYHYVCRDQSASKGAPNVHKLMDPVRVARIICEDVQSDPTLYPVALRLYATKLIRAATCYDAAADPAVPAARREAQQLLRGLTPALLRRSKAGWKRKLLYLFAAALPRFYNTVHQVYLK